MEVSSEAQYEGCFLSGESSSISDRRYYWPMRASLSLLAFFCVLALPAQARLGETKAECEKRYGTPTESGREDGRFSYLKNGVTIVARFREDKCVSITYRNSARPSAGSATPFTNIEIGILRAANEGGQVWELVPPGAPESVWETTTPPKKVARLSSNHSALNFTTKAEELRLKTEKAEKEKERLKDF